MSFILDALRKSEHERERRALPALVERTAGTSRRPRLPLVLAALGVLLLANLVVLAAYLRRPAPPPVAPAIPAPAAAIAPTAATMPMAAAQPAPRTRPLDSEASDAEPDSQAPEPPPTPRAQSGREPALVAPAGGRQSDGAGAAPTLNQLPDAAATGLPQLNIELHVYSDTPAERFVVLNGQRLREGSTLREGPTLERITPDGAILSYRGSRFQLPRQ